MEKSKIKVLIVDDEEGILQALQTHLEMDGYTVETSSSSIEALKWVEAGANYHIVLTDINMPNMDGIELLENIKKLSSTTIVIMITAYTTLMKVANSRVHGAADYLLKPFADLSEVDEVVQRAADQVIRWNTILSKTVTLKRQKAH